MKNKAIYPGTFDPVTNGHLDVVERATEIFDEVIIAVSRNSDKNTLFSLQERMTLLKSALKKKYACPVRIEVFSGLLVNFAKERKVKTLVRGLRAVSDFEYEFQMALMNRHQAPSIETVFLMPDEKYVYLSSSLVKEIARLGGRLTSFVPGSVISALKSKLR